MESLQIYWWSVISLLGAVLVFMLFVQGGQTLMFGRDSEDDRDLMVRTLGSKWEITFTTLVVFGGAFFASFPLYYSTCFGGAYWLWMLILLSFVLQAVSYEFRHKDGNVLGARTYDAFLFFNGSVGCVLLGVAVGMLFFGADFTVTRGNLTDVSSPVISVWNPTHGLEAIASWRNLLLGVTVLMLARTLAALYFINASGGDKEFNSDMRRAVIVNGAIFVVLFVAFAAVLLTAVGYISTCDNEAFIAVRNRMFVTMTNLWWLGLLLVVGVVMVLWGIGKTACVNGYRYGIWWAGIGTVMVIYSLLAANGYNGSAYLASTTSPMSSLTIYNSSSSEFTLRVMMWVSFFVPVVIGYIAYVWRQMNGRSTDS